MSRIFFLQATIFTVHLDERVIRDADGDTNFAVKINLLDLPSLAVPWNRFEENDLCEKNLDYYAGRGCHFVAKRRDIVKALKGKPLRMGVYRKEERFPRCHGVLPFSGCICDLISKSMEETSSFEFGGNFNLIEPGGNPAGNVALGIVLTELGRHVITSYALDRDSFVLKNEPEGSEYKCGRIKDPGFDSSPAGSDGCSATLIPEKLMRDIAGISLGALKLSQGKPQAKRARQPLEDLEEVADEGKLQEGKGSKKNAKNGSTKKRKER